MATTTGSKLGGAIYTATVTVASTTVPVSLMPPGTAVFSFICKPRAASTVNILIFPYLATLPGSAPSDTYELAASGTFYDTVSSAMSGADGGMGYGWAAILESAGSVTVDVVAR